MTKRFTPMILILRRHCTFVPTTFSLSANQDSLLSSDPQPHSQVGLPIRNVNQRRDDVNADDSSDWEYDEDEASGYEEDVDKAAQGLFEMNFEPALTLERKRIVQHTLDSLPYILPDTPPFSRSCTIRFR